MTKKWILLIALLFAACNDRSTADFIRFQDTVAILNCTINSQSFKTEIPSELRTLVVIKNKYYGNNWPERIGNFNVVYEQENAIGHGKFTSGDPLSFEVKDLKIAGDTGQLSIYNIKKKLLLSYTLLKTKNNWSIISTNNKKSK